MAAEPLGDHRNLRHTPPMTPVGTLLTLLAGGVAGGIATRAWLAPRLQSQQQALETTRSQLDEAATAQVHLAELQSQLSLLRHDLNGILSPALLSADRLVANENPATRKAGEIIIRTVERATARLAETKFGHEPPKSVQR